MNPTEEGKEWMPRENARSVSDTKVVISGKSSVCGKKKVRNGQDDDDDDDDEVVEVDDAEFARLLALAEAEDDEDD